MSDTYWPQCPCGDTGWRYVSADGHTGWRCWCGNHHPDQTKPADTVEVQLPLFETEAA